MRGLNVKGNIRTRLGERASSYDREGRVVRAGKALGCPGQVVASQQLELCLGASEVWAAAPIQCMPVLQGHTWLSLLHECGSIPGWGNAPP